MVTLTLSLDEADLNLAIETLREAEKVNRDFAQRTTMPGARLNAEGIADRLTAVISKLEAGRL